MLVSLAGFVAPAPVGMVLDRRRRARVPYDTDALPLHEETGERHRHTHGPGCGHLAIEHGDHVDYVHGTHHHALHGDHYDEHESKAEHGVDDHTHGDACGHEAVAHDDHVDYVHDGHRHAAHADHYDEH